MPRISLAFFTVAALCGVAGMIWGAQMGASGDHTMFPAHAHLNLVGWVSLSLMGLFYAVRGQPAGWLAWTNFVFSSAGALIMAPMLYWLLTAGDRRVGPLMPIAEVPIVLGMLAFLANVLMAWRRPQAA